MATLQNKISSWGNLLFMALIGLILASNIFAEFRTLLDYKLHRSFSFCWFNSLRYTKNKQLAAQVIAESEEGRKIAILGALRLYLDLLICSFSCSEYWAIGDK